jgi:cobalt/nickel transport system permease protein
MARISLIAAVVFVSSLIHIPVGFSSVHFTFTGLAGILLGPSSFLAVGIAIFLQWLLLFHGGITTLGINVFVMGSAALSAYFVFNLLRGYFPDSNKKALYAGVPAGIISALVKISLGSGFLVLGGFPTQTFFLLLLFNIPIILGEGIIAGVAARYLLGFSFNERKRGIWEKTISNSINVKVPSK